MTDWYVSTAAYAAIPAFQTSHAYNIGDLLVPTAPAPQAKWVLRCTTAGTTSTEPGWNTVDNNTTTSGTAVFTNVTGQSAYFWAAAAGDLPTLLGAVGGTNRVLGGDRVFISSDHHEAQTGTMYYGSGWSNNNGFGVILFLCVNRAGSTPPVEADLTTGATCTVNDTLYLRSLYNTYHYGIVYTCTGNGGIQYGGFWTDPVKTTYMKNCQVNITTTNNNRIWVYGRLVMDNTSMTFGASGQSIGLQASEIIWINTPNMIPSGAIPTVLFDTGYNAGVSGSVLFRGVDLSALTTTLLSTENSSSKILLDSCKISGSLTRYVGGQYASAAEQVQLYNCYDGTHIISEWYNTCGSVRTEFAITLSGGATDDVGAFSHKMVTSSYVNKFVSPLGGFWMDMQCIGTGTTQIATVEIVSSTTLNNDEIALFIEYEGTAGTSVTSFADSLALMSASSVASSNAAWNSLPSTPVRQKLQVSFTPRVSGRIRGQVRLGKPSTTVYYDPQMRIRYA